MKSITKIIIFLCCMINVHAELLVLKRLEPQTSIKSSSSRAFQSSITPLDATDERNYNAIARILLNYQWPMLVANPNLTTAEQDELLTADVENAEENFIRRKLQEIDPSYDVAFIPTSLYEMFIINIVDKKAKDPLYNFVKPFDEVNKKINIINEINGDGPLHDPWQDVDNLFNSINNQYYSNAFFYCNNKIIQDLITSYPIISSAHTGEEMSDAIKYLINDIGYKLSSEIFDRNKLFTLYEIFYKQIAFLNNTIHYHQALAQIIALEYEMRKKNKGLLVRGTNLVDIKKLNDEKFPIIGSTLIENEVFENIPKSYRNKSHLPYSISFGNSLFAGFFYDEGACVARFINDKANNCYGLAINKKEYIQHRSSSLFFISPLAPIASLFASGEFFHSRTKACILQNIVNKNQKVVGFAIKSSEIKDPDHIITTTNNPLVNAELFSNYLTQNGFILNIGKESIYSIMPYSLKKYQATDLLGLTPAEQDAFYQKIEEESNNLKRNQIQVSDYYKGIRQLTEHLPVATKQYRKKLDEKKLIDDIQKIMDSID